MQVFFFVCVHERVCTCLTHTLHVEVTGLLVGVPSTFTAEPFQWLFQVYFKLDLFRLASCGHLQPNRLLPWLLSRRHHLYGIHSCCINPRQNLFTYTFAFPSLPVYMLWESIHIQWVLYTKCWPQAMSWKDLMHGWMDGVWGKILIL